MKMEAFRSCQFQSKSTSSDYRSETSIFQITQQNSTLQIFVGYFIICALDVGVLLQINNFVQRQRNSPICVYSNKRFSIHFKSIFQTNSMGGLNKITENKNREKPLLRYKRDPSETSSIACTVLAHSPVSAILHTHLHVTCLFFL